MWNDELIVLLISNGFVVALSFFSGVLGATDLSNLFLNWNSDSIVLPALNLNVWKLCKDLLGSKSFVA